MTSDPVSLVIPGRNCAATIRQCLGAVVPLLDGPHLREIIFVDDGSTDDTAATVAEFPVQCVPGHGNGAGAARNVGWHLARHPLIWFIDSDCVAQPGALDRLLPHFDDPMVGGVSGSYGIMNPSSLLACLIHEEIVERHRAMPLRVDFLATFNVIYRRVILERLDGFDEWFVWGEDAELSWRVLEAGYELRLELGSRVNHYHESHLWSYLRRQREHGYWRVSLHLSHRGHAAGDCYSNLVDHLQPLLAMFAIATMPLGLLRSLAFIPATIVVLLLAAQIPMTARLLRRIQRPRYVAFAGMSFLRAFWRGVGMTHGILAHLTSYRRRSRPAEP